MASDALALAVKMSGMSIGPETVKSFKDMAAYISECTATAKETAFLSTDELMFGMYVLYNKHQKENVKERLEGAPCTDKALARKFGLQLHKHERTATPSRPSYYICVHEDMQTVALVVRGTSNKSDILTDLNAKSVEIRGLAGGAEGGGFTHNGMLRAANWFMENEFETLAALMAAHPGFVLKVVGHSLGAGTAAVFTWLLRSTPQPDPRIPVDKVSCTAVACPACLSENLAPQAASFITTVVLEDDVVPRVSLSSCVVLQLEISTTDWQTTGQRDLPPESIKTDVVAGLVKASKGAEAAAAAAKYGYKALGKAATAAASYEPRTSVGAALKSGATKIASMDMFKKAASFKTSKDSPEEAAAAYPLPPGADASGSTQQVPLYPPGRVLHCVRSGGTAEDVWAEPCGVAVVDVDVARGQFPRRIVFSRTWKSDHTTEFYLEALSRAIAA